MVCDVKEVNDLFKYYLQKPLFWSVLLFILLISSATWAGFLTLFLLLIPLLAIYLLTSYQQFAAWVGGVFLVSLLLTGLGNGILMLLTLCCLISAAVIMGELYKRNQPAKVALTAGVIAILGSFTIGMVFLALFSSASLTSMLSDWLAISALTLPTEMQDSLFNTDGNLTWTDWAEQMAAAILRISPLLLLLLSVSITLIAHAAIRRIFLTFGEKLPALTPIKTWMLPRSMIWYYIVALITSVFIQPGPESILYTVSLNIVPMFMLLFTVQAIGFLFFLADYKEWNKWLPISAIVLLFIFPPMYQLFSLLGFLDVALPIRQRLTKSS